MSTEQNKEIVRRFLEEPGRGNLAVVDEVFGENAVVHDPGRPAPPPGPEGQKRVISGVLAAFPDFQFTVDDAIAEGDKVAIRYTGRGTHKGTFNGIPATNKQVTFTGSAIYRIADGKIQEGWALVDVLGLLQQLGVVPPRP